MSERANIRRIEAIESVPFVVRFNAAVDIDKGEWKRIAQYMQKYAFEKPREDMSEIWQNQQKLRSLAALKLASPTQFAACVGERQLFTGTQLNGIVLFAFHKRERAENCVAIQTLQPKFLPALNTPFLQELLENMQKMRKSKIGNDFGLSIMFAGNIKRLFPEAQPMGDDFVAEAKEYIERLLARQEDQRLQERDAMGALAFAAQIRICRPDQAVQFTRAQWRIVTDTLHKSLRQGIGTRDPQYILWAAIVGADAIRMTDHGIEITPPKDPEIKPVPEALSI